MGSLSSKIARGTTTTIGIPRKYPTKPTLLPSSSVVPKSSTVKSTITQFPPSFEPINTNSTEDEDSKFTTSLLNIGPVDLSSSPSFSSSPSSSTFPLPPPPLTSSQQAQHSPTSSLHANNPALRILAARQSIAADVAAAAAAAAETGRGKNSGREYLPVGVLRTVLGMRDHNGVGAGEIERGLGLKRGVVERLGGRGVVGLVGGDDGRG